MPPKSEGPGKKKSRLEKGLQALHEIPGEGGGTSAERLSLLNEGLDELLAAYPKNHKEIANYLLENDMSFYVLEALPRFTGLDHSALALRFLKDDGKEELGRGKAELFMRYIEKFSGLSFAVALQMQHKFLGALIPEHIERFSPQAQKLLLEYYMTPKTTEPLADVLARVTVSKALYRKALFSLVTSADAATLLLVCGQFETYLQKTAGKKAEPALSKEDVQALWTMLKTRAERFASVPEFAQALATASAAAERALS